MVAGGMRGCRGHVWLQGGVCGCWGGMCGCPGAACMVAGGGVCVVAGGMHGCGGGACIGYDEIRSMNRWYASYWNAFLLKNVISVVYRCQT